MNDVFMLVCLYVYMCQPLSLIIINERSSVLTINIAHYERLTRALYNLYKHIIHTHIYIYTYVCMSLYYKFVFIQAQYGTYMRGAVTWPLRASQMASDLSLKPKLTYPHIITVPTVICLPYLIQAEVPIFLASWSTHTS